MAPSTICPMSRYTMKNNPRASQKDQPTGGPPLIPVP